MQKIHQYREAIDSCFQLGDTPRSMQQVISWVDVRLPDNRFTRSTFTAQVHKACVNVASAYQSKAPKILFYSKSDRTYRRATEQEVIEGVQSYNETIFVADSDLENIHETSLAFKAEETFALEADLQRYLVRNLQKLESGLTLWDITQPVEYPLAGRRIDILAKDAGGVPVVVELKLSRGLYSVIGQALHYRGLVKKHLNVERVRIMIVASEISDELKLASAEIADVSMWEYTLSMQVEKV